MAKNREKIVFLDCSLQKFFVKSFHQAVLAMANHEEQSQ